MESELTTNELLDILSSRYSSYIFLARVYKEEVSSALLHKLVNNEILRAAEDTISEEHQLLESFAREARESDPVAMETQLAVEYASLFLNAGRHPVFPYESVYTSREKLVMQKARDEVLSEYRQEGLDKAKGFNEPEDHIAVELEFMAYLCQKTIEAMEKSDKEGGVAYLEKQGDFLGKHLMVWVPDFCEDLEQAAESDFYKGIAKLTKDFLSLEQEAIEELITELQGWPDIDL